MAVIGTAYEKGGSPGPLVETRDTLTISRMFIVKTDSRADGPIIVMGAAGLPQIGNSYSSVNESHPYLFCVRRSPARISDKSRNWVVTCEYETPTQNNQRPDQPEFELPVIRTGSYPVTKQLEQDIDGNLIDNSAGDPFKPAPTDTLHYLSLHITRNEPISSPILTTQATYQGKLNSDTFWGQPAGKWLCNQISSSLDSRTVAGGDRYSFLRVSYEFQYAPSWKFEPLDKGYYYINGAGKRVGNRTADGQPYEGLLNAGAATITPVYLDFNIKQSVAFSGLQLPQSYLDAVY